MKRLLAVALISASTLAHASLSQHATSSDLYMQDAMASGSGIVQHTVTDLDCKNVAKIALGAALARGKGITLDAVLAALFQPVLLKDEAYRAMLPAAVGSVNNAFDNAELDPPTLMDIAYRGCKAFVDHPTLLYK